MTQPVSNTICLSKAVPELFFDVQTQRVFQDSKIFADARPKRSVSGIRADYCQLRAEKDVDLLDFIHSNFDLPVDPSVIAIDHSGDVWSYIEQLWLKLTREPESDSSSLLHLPNPYVVPGGRFREIYYWDSYFTMLGLAHSGHTQLVGDMVDNFASLMRNYGVIPNGNRAYYLSRTQPPYFALMVQLLAKLKGNELIILEYLDVMEAEYAYWMKGQDQLAGDGDAQGRVVRVKGCLLNRYHDDLNEPRPESFFEDQQLSKELASSNRHLFQDIRSACESGWDFSSRWFADAGDFASIETTRVVPVDLNCLMYELEVTLARAFQLSGLIEKYEHYQRLAQRREQAIQSLFFDSQQGWFFDLNLNDGSFRPAKTLAAAYPLYARLATREQADRVAQTLKSDFLSPGGWVTSTYQSHQQWDSPNGWAPLQWTVYRGLSHYGFDALARSGAEAWISNVMDLYQKTGKLYEKYDVVDTENLAGGGEYLNQHGFGWTNAILLKLQAGLQQRS